MHGLDQDRHRWCAWTTDASLPRRVHQSLLRLPVDNGGLVWTSRVPFVTGQPWTVLTTRALIKEPGWFFVYPLEGVQIRTGVFADPDWEPLQGLATYTCRQSPASPTIRTWPTKTRSPLNWSKWSSPETHERPSGGSTRPSPSHLRSTNGSGATRSVSHHSSTRALSVNAGGGRPSSTSRTSCGWPSAPTATRTTSSASARDTPKTDGRQGVNGTRPRNTEC